MRILELPAGKSPREWGRIHGERFRGEIASLAAIRVYLCTKVGGVQDARAVLAAATAHLPVLRDYDGALYDELVGIAEGAAVAPEQIVVVNHYTDLRDLDPDPSTWKPAPIKDDPTCARRARARGLGGDGCSVFGRAPTGRILAQTWDMHATAIPYVMLLAHARSGDGPAAKLLTVTGCLGMAGMNASRVAIAINNLFSTDATLGVVWPAIVRRALREPDAPAARELIATSRSAAGTTTSSPTARRVRHRDLGHAAQASSSPAAHALTAHEPRLDADVAAVSKVPGTSTTHERLRSLEAELDARRCADLDDIWQRARLRRRLAAQRVHEHGDARGAARRGDVRRDRDEPRHRRACGRSRASSTTSRREVLL